VYNGQSRLQAKQEGGGHASLQYAGVGFFHFILTHLRNEQVTWNLPKRCSCQLERIRNNYQKYYKLTFFLDPGTLDAVTKMIRFEGLAGFYKGMNTKIVQSVVAAAVLFMIKEELVKAARTLVTVQPKAPRLRL
jgi:hypothetical protein